MIAAVSCQMHLVTTVKINLAAHREVQATKEVKRGESFAVVIVATN